MFPIEIHRIRYTPTFFLSTPSIAHFQLNDNLWIKPTLTIVVSILVAFLLSKLINHLGHTYTVFNQPFSTRNNTHQNVMRLKRGSHKYIE